MNLLKSTRLPQRVSAIPTAQTSKGAAPRFSASAKAQADDFGCRYAQKHGSTEK